MKCPVVVVAILLSCLQLESAFAAVTGQWDFDAGNLSATVGVPLQFRGDTAGQTMFGSTTTFGIPGINGQPAQVMKFPACLPTQGFLSFHGVSPSGGGARGNRYSVILDVFFPAASTGFRSLWQTDVDSVSDGDFFINAAHGIGVSAQYQGSVAPGQWHRVVFTVDCTRRELGKYIDGTNVLNGPVGIPPLGTNALQYLDPVEGAADGRWSLDESALLFADDDSETGAGYVNSVQIQDRVLTPAQVSALGGPSPAGIPLGIPATVAQWDFNGSLASSTGGSNLVAGAASPAGLPGFAFTNLLIGGEPAEVMSFTRGTFFRSTHGFVANGGGAFVSSYTLIMDVMFPSRPTGWAALWQTSTANTNDGDWFVNPAAGVGISGNYGGTVADGSWHRLALVIDAAAGTLTSFINGQQVQQIGGVVVDGRWSLAQGGLLFADENQENAGGFVNSVQLRSRALAASEVADLGGPSAAGIPVPALPTLRIVVPNGGEVYQAGTTQKVTWTVSSPSGGLQVDLLRGGELYRSLGQAAMRDSNFVWVISTRLGDSNNYQIRLSSLNFPSVRDVSDQPFTVFGSAPPTSPAFDEPLQSNGGFEQQLAQWQTIVGNPTTLTSTGGKGAPHGGARFFHGGLNPSGDATIRQEIDLMAAGFTAFDIDSGAALDTEAWLRNRYGVNTFDDQVFCRVGYLNENGVELSSVRCMVAGNNVWLRRILVGLLPPGTRKLSLEIVGRHRRDLDNDSMADDLVVKLQEATPVSPVITKLPMLQDVRTNAMTLFWETDGNLAHHSVQWGRSNVNERTLTRVETLQIDATHFVHRATLAGLEIETSYSYRVQSGNSVSPVFTFRTAPRTETPFAVAWWGDNHQGTATLRTHVANMLAHGPDLICVAGDMVNSGDQLDEWHNYWFKPLEHLQLAQTRPVIYARGNHDGEHALAYAYSALPGNEAWFAFDYGNTRFIFLDSETATSGTPEQLAWLRNELSRPETQRAAFRVVCFHRPPYVNLWNGGGHTGEAWVQTDWVPLFEEKNVDIVICGHAHNYNRGVQRGVTYVVSGGGGGTIDVERVANWPLYTVEYSRYHFDLMEVVDETLYWQTFDDQNRLLDSFTLKSRRGMMEWGSGTPVAGTQDLIVSGKPGTTYVVERSANLLAWTTYATNVLAGNGSGLATNRVTTTNSYFFRSRAL